MNSSAESYSSIERGISFVLPCLNEQAGLTQVVESLHREGIAAGLVFEIVIVDNNSTDDSPTILKKLQGTFSNVRAVHEVVQGYGSATRSGIMSAHNTLIVCLDADGTYTVEDAVVCAKTLLANPHSFVIGNRLTAHESKESMPWLHRTIGTPVIALLLRTLFGVKISDPNCGLRGFSKKNFISLGCVSTGMEFASEEIARASHSKINFIEFPISYKKRIGESKLRTFRDGIRHAFTIFVTRVKLFGMPQ